MTELGAMYPRSGGIKIYLEEAFRRPRFLATTQVCVQAVLLGFTASNCIIFAKYMLYAANIEPSGFSTKLLAVGLLTLITIIHGCFYKTGIFIQNFLGWLKIGLTAFMILTGIAVLFRSKQPVPTWDSVWSGSQWGWGTLSTALFKALYSYAGLENVNNVLSEVKNPIRTIKSVGPVSLFTACFVYMLINIAYLAVVPIDEIKQSRELIAALFFDKMGFGRAFLPIAIALSAAGNVMVVTFSLVRRLILTSQHANLPGSPQARNRTIRLPPLTRLFGLECTFRRTTGRIDHPLHTQRYRDCLSIIRYGVQLHCRR